MKTFIIFSFLIVTLLARNRKHYLVEVEDKNEIIDEKEKNHEDVENDSNHEEKNTDEEKKGPSIQQNKAFQSFGCTDGARCHRRPGKDNCYCQGPDCEIETSLDGREIFAKGRNAVCESKGTPGVTIVTFLLQ